MTTMSDPDRHIGRHRHPDDKALAGMQQWLDSLPVTDEPALICPAPDVHRGLYIAREVTWRLPLETFKAELASPQCPWCGLTKYKGGPL